MPRLILNPNSSSSHVFPLNPGANRIGRMPGFEIEVADRSLSRDHARIDVTDGVITLSDHTSRNGTYVNGARVTRQVLAPGDLIRCGEVQFRLEDDPEPLMLASVPWEANSLSHDSIEELLDRHPSSDESALNLPAVEPAARQHSKLKILLRVSEVLSLPGDRDAVLGRILDLLFQILDIDRGVILLGDGEAQLRPVVQRSRLPSSSDPFFSTTIVDHVRQQGLPALFANPQDDLRLPPAQSIVGLAILSCMGAPLRTHGRTFGVVYVDNLTRPNRFSEEDLEFLGAFANQAAIAIDNAELYKRIEAEALLRHNLQRFFPPNAVERITELAHLGVVETEVTTLFCDISDFTGLAERTPPRDLVAMLNVYFPKMSEVVFRHEGTLEKYIGDALLAVWGAPVAYADHADRAVAAALDMQADLAAVNTQLAERGLTIRVHIGLHSGLVAAGNIGSDGYLQYATIGDTTNIASRVADAAAAGQVVVSSETAARLAAGRWRLESLGRHLLKGKGQAVELYEVTGRAPA